MSLYKRNDSPHWWVKISHSGTTIQRSTGTGDKAQAQEYHDKLKASLWEQQRLGVKPRRAWKEAVVRWLAETSDKATHQEDVNKLRWLDPLLGPLMLDEITLDVIDGIKAEKLKTASKSTVNRHLGLVRAILRRARDEWEWIDKMPKVKLFKEPPGGSARSPWSKPRRFSASCRRISAMWCSSRWPRVCGSRTCVGLEWSHVDLDAGHAWVSAGQSKNRRPIAVPLNATALEVLRRQLGKHRVECLPMREAAWKCQHDGMEKGLEACRHREFPLARFAAHLGLVASAVGDADARAAASRRLAVFGDGRTLRASRARPSRESRQPARFAARWLRFGYAGRRKRDRQKALIPCNNWCRQ